MDKPKPLSRKFLVSRGYCCGGGCLNCPYFPIHTKGSTEVFEMPQTSRCYPSCSGKTMQEGLCMCYLEFKEENK
jgi:hypothetical protein